MTAIKQPVSVAKDTAGECLKEWCRSPLACSGWGYCREWNFIDNRHLTDSSATIKRGSHD